MALKSVLLIVLPVLVLLFCYQNCQKPPYSDVINGSQNAAISSVDQKIISDLDQSAVQQIVFNERMPIQMNQSGKVYTLQDLVQFSVDFQSGVVEQLTSQNKLLAKYCLNLESIKSLKALLAAGKVCEFRASGAANQVCSQMATPGYAKLSTNQGDLEVGFASDSCGSVRTDFCDDRGANIKAWFTEFKANLIHLSCPQ